MNDKYYFKNQFKNTPTKKSLRMNLNIYNQLNWNIT